MPAVMPQPEGADQGTGSNQPGTGAHILTVILLRLDRDYALSYTPTCRHAVVDMPMSGPTCRLTFLSQMMLDVRARKRMGPGFHAVWLLISVVEFG
jgi:hypothetical protein